MMVQKAPVANREGESKELHLPEPALGLDLLLILPGWHRPPLPGTVGIILTINRAIRSEPQIAQVIFHRGLQRAKPHRWRVAWGASGFSILIVWNTRYQLGFCS